MGATAGRAGAAPSPSRHHVAGFVATLLTVCFGGGWIMAQVWPGEGVARAIWMSVAIAIVVQLAAFGIARAYIRTNFMAGWGAGFLLRLGSLAVYAMFGVKALALPATPALMSLVGFFLVTMFLEPLFLKS